MILIRAGAALLSVALALATSPAAADDAQDIVGIWEPVEVESEGTALAAEQVKMVAVVLTFKITKDKISTPLDDDDTEISYTLTPDSTPKRIDTLDVNGPAKGEKRKGIYELKGDTFRMCIAAKDAVRPKNFTTKAGGDGGDLLVKFQRKR